MSMGVFVDRVKKKMIQDQHLDKVLAAVQSNREEELPKVILEAKDWCFLYHLSRARKNLIEWIPVEPEEEILEFGAECGALTGMLCERAARVTSLEIDGVKCEINRTRNREKENLTVIQGGLSALQTEAPEKTYDKIFLIGSLPLAELYLSKEQQNPYQTLLFELKKRLKPEGRLILALPNRLGLKYFAGCLEDYFGAPFTGLEDYYYHKGMRTFGKKELTDLLSRSGFPDVHFYYPYPDYRFMKSLYSDKHLPRAGELNTNLVNFDQDRYVFFDEMKVFDGLVKEELFPELSNSFLVITGQTPVSEVIYTRYSVERAETFRIRTDIVLPDGKDLSDAATPVTGEPAPVPRENALKRKTPTPIVRKTALTKEADAHLAGMQENQKRIAEAYQDCGIFPCACRLQEGKLTFAYAKGDTLQQILERLVMEHRREEITALLNTYRERISRPCTDPFQVTPAFEAVFGKTRLPDGLLAARVSDVDLIFSNLICESEDRWIVIDYEWTFSFPVPLHYLLYRAYYFASHEIQPCEELSLEHLLHENGITEKEAAQYRVMEQRFQTYVTGGKQMERDLLIPIGNRIIPITEMDKAYREKETAKRRFPWRR